MSERTWEDVYDEICQVVTIESPVERACENVLDLEAKVRQLEGENKALDGRLAQMMSRYTDLVEARNAELGW